MAESPHPATTDPRWIALAGRDAAADGRFVYGVASTGVFCRPSCPARSPSPRNVRFFDTPAAAVAAGFRPCLRCRPTGPTLAEEHAARVTAACRAIEQATSTPSVAELAAIAGLGASRFHRVFRALTGLTPRGYAAAHRAARARSELAARPTVTDALHAAGFGSSGRFYEAADGMLGMTPTDWRAGGAGTSIRFAVGESSLGAVLVACTTRGVCAILLGDDPDALVRDLQDRFPRADLLGGDAAFEGLVARVVGLVERPRVGLDLPLDVRGTAFQQRVWRALTAIPAGSTATYAELAAAIDAPAAVRAVAGACAANPLAVAIPCHRVVRSDGSLSGYRWGVERKAALLARERDPS